jgi:hypothetical protein
MNVGRNDFADADPLPNVAKAQVKAQAVATAAKIQKFHLPH